jgi:hypothetical protein
MVDDNPYKSSDLPHDGKSPATGAPKFGPVFMYSYGTSVVVAFTVAFIWLTVVHGVVPGVSRETPDVAKLGTLFAATTPSILTCLFFSLCYWSIVKRHKNPTIWPAILFGLLSGSIFNVMTEIMLIEYFFDW